MKPIKNLNGFVRSLRSNGFNIIASRFDGCECHVQVTYPYDILVRVPGLTARQLFDDLYLNNCRLLTLVVVPSIDRKYIFLNATFYDLKECSYCLSSLNLD